MQNFLRSEESASPLKSGKNQIEQVMIIMVVDCEKADDLNVIEKMEMSRAKSHQTSEWEYTSKRRR